MKKARFAVSLVIGLGLAFAVMWGRGLFSADTADEIVMAVSDGFSVAGLIFLGIGSLIWVSTTGLFDIFAFALKKGAHALIPGMVSDPTEDYYEYKMEKKEKRKGFTQLSSLIVGIVFVAIGLVLAAVWYQLVEG